MTIEPTKEDEDRVMAILGPIACSVIGDRLHLDRLVKPLATELAKVREETRTKYQCHQRHERYHDPEDRSWRSWPSTDAAD